ncbi:UTP--glucose-1-phosphate uridylyltransferase GalU [Paraburkholderia caballeronis]|uniref:UTP--glucose-1-phosphate uridylyltransferase GalU n=1 Tax=Paraburkholderia caballeronis TaxID=416943 RepID=UPI001066D162|nr:UTP--glucose-1-phosphate uridylyltransferase GalU [Paraburkholderia caballeronis]TDV18268.1 UDP-glucose pyrophosphorylase [Paraburkholderia caballeronis]TDV20194.1 UDP-glucose pyrophosphorylase [Paraburkholderia caballeronis]TDV28411.1 UDP-glucose pyrophosphorylase [Paraburkholderia caballeronis]
MIKVRKAVFPVAGLGTRFLPATKASPKEMLPVVDKPLIQYAVEEAVAAGVTEMIFVTGRGKRAIEDHFDKSYEIECELKARGKAALLECVQRIKPANVECFFVRQPEPLGLGHAVLCAQKIVGDEPFAVLLADDLLDATTPVLAQMLERFDHYHCSMVAVEEIERQDSRSYGVVDARRWDEHMFRMTRIVEKPAPAAAPSTLGVVGRYVLMPRIFEHLRRLRPAPGDEIQLSDAIQSMLVDEQVLAYRINGKRFDCGSKVGYLQAMVEFALRHPEVRDEFGAWLRERVGDLGGPGRGGLRDVEPEPPADPTPLPEPETAA